MSKSAWEPTDEAAAAFMAELLPLARRHGIVIGACGCCGSPWLVTIESIRQGDCTIPDSIDLNLSIDQLDPLPEFKM